jgi:hypothetical protein
MVSGVDQEDKLMSTLKAYETAIQCLFEAKQFRTLETMQEWDILGMKDSIIEDSSKKSIS